MEVHYNGVKLVSSWTWKWSWSWGVF